MYPTIKKQRKYTSLYFFFLIFTLLSQNFLYAQTTIYTPEGRPVSAYTFSEMSQNDIDYCHWYIQYYYIDPYQLNAVRIGNASQTYNCHGYAWSLSESNAQVWIQNDEETKFFSDGDWSNDGQPSYLSASESEATHSWYTDDDHSVRKIQNSYPCAIEGGRDYVSKWGNCGLYQHAKNHDCYYLKQNLGHAFKKLKATHSGTLSNYPKTWIGVGGKTHTISGNISCPNNLTIKSGATVDLNTYSIVSTGGTITKENGATINSLKAIIKAGNDIKGIYPSSYTVQQLIDLSTSGWNINLVSGTYTENLNMKAGVSVSGTGSSSTTINGTVTFNSTDNSSLSDAAVNGKISVNSSYDVALNNVKANNANCYVDAYGSSVTIEDMVSELSQTRGLYAHNSSSYFVDNSSFRNKYDGQNLEDISWGENAGVTFCQNQTYDIVAFHYSYVDNYWCAYSSATEGSTVYGDVSWYSWYYCGMGKRSASMAKTLLSKTDGDDPDLDDYKNVMSFYKTVRDEIKNDIKEGKENAVQNHSEELKEVVNEFEKFIDEHNGSKYSPVVLGMIASVLEMLEEYEEMLSYMTEIAEDKELNHLRPYALNSIVTLYVKMGENGKGMDLSDQLLNEYPDHMLAVEWLYGKGLIYKYGMNDNTKAEEMFKEVITKCPDHATAISAKEQLGIKEEFIPKEQVAAANIPIEFAAQNHPNPFNPSTTISYTLPEAGRVQIKVFDALGREVTTLIDGFNNKGFQKVEWNGSNVASGIYFYSVSFNNQTLYKKMLLVK